MYYCLDCQKKIKKPEEQDIQFECPHCGQDRTLFKMDEDDTDILKGKVIKEVYTNQWEDISRLIVFEDGTHALVEVPYSDEIEITLLEHDYDEDDECDCEEGECDCEDEEDDGIFGEILDIILKEKNENKKNKK